MLEYIELPRQPQSKLEQLMLGMFYYSFYSEPPAKRGFANLEEGIAHILASEPFRLEIADILRVNLSNLSFVDRGSAFPYANPLDVHCRYNLSQILAAFGFWDERQAPEFREGVKYFEDKRTDVFFITLNKSEKDFSPSTQYEDYAINERLFHWQSQSRIAEETPTAQRYIHHRQTGNRIALFVREYKKENGYTSPYLFVGEAEYVRHEGNRPVSFVWRLKEELPPAFVPVANKCIG